MPVHDWTRVDAGIFHAFHHDWITELGRALNRGLLPADYYALPEQITGGREPDVVTLRGPTRGDAPGGHPAGSLALAARPPQVDFRRRPTRMFMHKAKAIVIRHTSGHQVIAVVEIVSPGNKNNRHGVRAFVEKAGDLMRGGINLLIIDLFPAGPRDPQGMPKTVWDAVADNSFSLPAGRPLSVGAVRRRSGPGSVHQGVCS